MIFVEIIIESIETSYDFEINENETAKSVIKEIIKSVCLQERIHALDESDTEKFILCDKTQRKILSPSNTVKSNGVMSGHTLVLI